MKKLLLIAVLLFVGQTAQADPLIQPNQPQVATTDEVKLINFKEIPNIKSGVFYAVDDAKLNALVTTDIAKYKWLTLEAGYSGDAENTNHKAVLSLSIDLLHVGDWIKFPILDKIVFRPGYTIGFGNLNFKEMTDAEFTHGPSLTAFEWKF